MDDRFWLPSSHTCLSHSSLPLLSFFFLLFRLSSVGAVNAFHQQRQARISVFWLHCCAAVQLYECVCVCVGRICFCLRARACVSTCVHQSCSPLLSWQRRAHGSGSFVAHHFLSRAAGGLFCSVLEKCLHKHLSERLMYRLRNRLITTSPVHLWSSLWQQGKNKLRPITTAIPSMMSMLLFNQSLRKRRLAWCL